MSNAERNTRTNIRNAHIISTIEEMKAAKEYAGELAIEHPDCGYLWQVDELSKMLDECYSEGVECYGDLPL